jgi:dihydrofolate reductase
MAERFADLILAVDATWGIGKDNALPWPKLPADLRHFKEVSTAAPEGRRNAVVMGRRTWESKEVGGRALPRRHNLVLTRRPFETPVGVQVVTSARDGSDAIGQALGRATELPDLGEIFIIGGAEIYRMALAHPSCRAIYLTRVVATFDCDTFVPNLDELCVPDPSWPVAHHEENGVAYSIEKLLLRRPPRT